MKNNNNNNNGSSSSSSRNKSSSSDEQSDSNNNNVAKGAAVTMIHSHHHDAPPYIFHPKEWTASALICCLLFYARFVHHHHHPSLWYRLSFYHPSSTNGDHHRHHNGMMFSDGTTTIFENVFSSNDVHRQLHYQYCDVDKTVLCMNEQQHVYKTWEEIQQQSKNNNGRREDRQVDHITAVALDHYRKKYKYRHNHHNDDATDEWKYNRDDMYVLYGCQEFYGAPLVEMFALSPCDGHAYTTSGIEACNDVIINNIASTTRTIPTTTSSSSSNSSTSNSSAGSTGSSSRNVVTITHNIKKKTNTTKDDHRQRELRFKNDRKKILLQKNKGKDKNKKKKEPQFSDPPAPPAKLKCSLRNLLHGKYGDYDQDDVPEEFLIVNLFSTVMMETTERSSKRFGWTIENRGFYNDEEREALIEYYVNYVMDLFSEPVQQHANDDTTTSTTTSATGTATTRAVQGEIVERVYKRSELMKMLKRAAKPFRSNRHIKHVVSEMEEQENKRQQQKQQSATKEKDEQSSSTKPSTTTTTASRKASESRQRRLGDLTSDATTRSSSSSSSAQTSWKDGHQTPQKKKQKQKQKHQDHYFYPRDLDQCMVSHFDDETLVTQLCRDAMKAARTKLWQLRAFPVSTDFVIMTHFGFLSINLICLLMLLQSFTLRKRYVKKMDAGRRRLQEELNDPVLRASLEHKAKQLYDTETDRNHFIMKLQDKLQTWDSSSAASQHTVKWVKRLRNVLLLTILCNIAIGIVLAIFHEGSRTRFLESLLSAFFLWTVSYAIPVTASSKDADRKFDTTCIELSSQNSVMRSKTSFTSGAPAKVVSI